MAATKTALGAVTAGVLVLSVGGTAAASGLTHGAVRRIATKVVAKKAPGLSVAHAATASDATTLAGRPASAYQDELDVFPLVSTTSSSFKSFTLTALTPGTYD